MPSSASACQHVLGHHPAGIVIGLGQRHFELAVEGLLAGPDGGARLGGDLLAPAPWSRLSSISGATTRLIRPIRARVRAETISPVSSISIAALARDIARQRHHRRGAEQADIRRPAWRSARYSDATARSQLATSWQPAAVAMPCTSAITGLGCRTMVCISREHWVNRAAKAARPLSRRRAAPSFPSGHGRRRRPGLRRRSPSPATRPPRPRPAPPAAPPSGRAERVAGAGAVQGQAQHRAVARRNDADRRSREGSCGLYRRLGRPRHSDLRRNFTKGNRNSPAEPGVTLRTNSSKRRFCMPTGSGHTKAILASKVKGTPFTTPPAMKLGMSRISCSIKKSRSHPVCGLGLRRRVGPAARNTRPCRGQHARRPSGQGRLCGAYVRGHDQKGADLATSTT